MTVHTIAFHLIAARSLPTRLPRIVVGSRSHTRKFPPRDQCDVRVFDVVGEGATEDAAIADAVARIERAFPGDEGWKIGALRNPVQSWK